MPTVARLTTRSFALIFVLVSVSCTSPSQHAVAQPPGFPKLDEFTPVSIDNYIEIPPKGLRYAYFSTPYNIQCWFEAGEPVPVWQSQDINCLGTCRTRIPAWSAKQRAYDQHPHMRSA